MTRVPTPAAGLPSVLPCRAVLDAVDDAIVIHDAHTGQILDVNQAACDLYGFTREEFAGLRVEDLSSGRPPHTQAEALRWVRRAAGEGPQRFEWHARDREGRFFWVEVSLRHARFSEGPRVVASVRDISERKRAEESLRESEERFQGAFRHASVGMAICSTDGRFLQVNRSLCELLGRSEAELQELTFLDVTHPEDREFSGEQVRRLQSGEVRGYQLEKRYVAKSGRVVWASVAVSGVRDAAGRVLHEVCQVTDVTERRRALEELRDSERRFRKLVETMSDGLVVRNPENILVYANPRFGEILGVPHKELIGRHLDELHDEENRRLYRERVARRPAGDRESYVLTWLAADGSPVETRLAPCPLFGEDGSFRGSFAVVTDLTERRRAEQDLRESEERFRLLVETMGDGLAARDAAGRFSYVNRRFCEMVGYTRDELLGMLLTDLLDEPNREILAQQRATRARGALEPYTLTFTRKDGEALTAIISPRWLYDAQGRLRTSFAVVTDITDRQRAEEALRESEEKYRALIETTDTGYLIVDAGGRVLDANAEYVRLAGYDCLEEILGRSVLEWTAPHDVERNAREVEKAGREGGVRNLVMDYLDRGGRITPIEINASVIETRDGQHILAVCRDISARRGAEAERAELERELSRSRALEAVGRLAGGVAHDFNNLLGGILGCVYVARLAVGDAGAGASELTRIESLCKRGGELTRQMLTVARRQAGSVQPLAVGPLVGELKDLLAHTLPKDIRLEVVVAAHLPRVRAERSLLTTALLNLALNARDAMPMGGTLAVRAVPHTDGEGREWVELAVADSGVGIPEGVRDLIFQPFYTTKDVGKGTGLGLSTAYAAVEGWGGKLAVSSTEGRGSTFTIRLPAADGEAAARPTPGEDTEVAHPLSRAPVLVVEDEEDVARLMTHALESRGYGVSRVGTGLQALERLREGPEDLGLVVLDLILPEWGGEGVYRMLRGLAPEVPVLLVSGREDLAEALAPQGPRLTKPFTAAEFLGAVAAALSGKERAS